MLGYNLFKLWLHYPSISVNLAWGYRFIEGWQLPTCTHTLVYPTPDPMGSSNLSLQDHLQVPASSKHVLHLKAWLLCWPLSNRSNICWLCRLPGDLILQHQISLRNENKSHDISGDVRRVIRRTNIYKHRNLSHQKSQLQSFTSTESALPDHSATVVLVVAHIRVVIFSQWKHMYLLGDRLHRQRGKDGNIFLAKMYLVEIRSMKKVLNIWFT